MHKETIDVALVQADLYWENVTANLAMLEEQLEELNAPADVIVLPEMFNTGFSMNAASTAEPPDFTTMRWMKQVAQRKKALVIGSIAMKESGQFFNRLICMFPDGTSRHYNKRHLFRMGNEHEVYSPGTGLLTVDWKGWKIRPLVCYDLRFPVWSRNVSGNSYDLLIYVANWPARRAYAWNTLLKARAIENQSYVIGVNRVGDDGKGIGHQGDSQAIDFLGETLSELGANPSVKIVSLAAEPLDLYRKSFPAWQDADHFHIDL